MSAWAQILIEGILAGGLYALFAAGLSMSFGVMRLVNLAHGDLIVFASFGALLISELLGISPWWTLPIMVAFMFALGYGLQHSIFNRLLGSGELPPLLATFGLAALIQNGLLQVFSADNRKLAAGDIEVASIALGGDVSIGELPLLLFAASLTIIFSLNLLFYRTALGRAFRAASDDPRTLAQMGVNPQRIYAIAMGLAMAVCAVAAVFLAIKTQFTPLSGPQRLIFAFEAVIIGGLGSLWGTFIGALLLGVAQAVGGAIDPVMQTLAGHVLFFLILLVRPQGLMPTNTH